MIQPPFVSQRVGNRQNPFGQRGNVGTLLVAARIGPIGMQKVVLKIDNQQARACRIKQ
jgi:hypothetical protein